MVKLELSTSSGLHLHVFVLVQLQSYVRLLATSWAAPCQAFLSFTVSWSLFQWVDSSQQVDKISELQLQHYSFQRIFRVDFLQDWLIWSPCCPRDSRVFSSTTIGMHQFFSAQPCLWFNSHIHTWLLERYYLTILIFVGKIICLLFNMLCSFFIPFLPRSK